MLTEKQKRYIESQREKKSVEDIAKHLGVSENDVQVFMKQRGWLAHADDSAGSSNRGLKSAITSASFRSWSDLVNYVKSHRHFFLFLIGITIAVYVNAVDNAFVADDMYGIVNNPQIGNIGLALRQLNGHRLLKDIIYLLFGKSLFAYHAVNILFHVANSVLAYFFVFILTKSKRISSFSSLIFALHPIQTESVTWISGGRYPMYAFFFLLSFLSFHFYLEDKKKRRFLTYAVAGFFIALFSNLWALSLTAVYFLYAQFVRKEKFVWEFYVPIAGLCLGYLLMIRGQAASRVSQLSTAAGELGAGHNILVTIPHSITQYLYLLFWPIPLTIYHEGGVLTQTYVWFARFLSLLVLVGVPLFLRKNKTLLFFFAFFFVVIVFSLSPIQLGWYVAERYVYLAVVAFAVFVSYFLVQIEKKLKAESLAITLIVLLLIFYSVRTVVRNNEWQSRATLWFATARVSPRSPKAHNNLGDIYGGMGDLEKSLQSFQRARELKPGYADATHNLANTYLQMGDLENAKKYFKEAIEYNPQLYQSYFSLGAIAYEEEEYEKARQYFEKVLKIVPNYEPALEALQVLDSKSPQ